MKFISSFCIGLLLLSCVSASENALTGSTPANSDVVRNFLGIPLNDSIDFIRWKITIQDDQYFLKCNYGIGKPNTNGFLQGGKWVELNGQVKKDNHFYFLLQPGNKSLGLLELNNNLFHLLDEKNSLLIGNGGWSYTLNRLHALPSDSLNAFPKYLALKDTMSFQGRTPCWNFPLSPPGASCIKKKWLIVFYTDPVTKEPTTYHLNGNSRGEGGTKGKWKITTLKNGRVVYQLFSEKEPTPLELVVLDENLLAFADRRGNLLVGNEDFSYTLNKR